MKKLLMITFCMCFGALFLLTQSCSEDPGSEQAQEQTQEQSGEKPGNQETVAETKAEPKKEVTPETTKETVKESSDAEKVADITEQTDTSDASEVAPEMDEVKEMVVEQPKDVPAPIKGDNLAVVISNKYGKTPAEHKVGVSIYDLKTKKLLRKDLALMSPDTYGKLTSKYFIAISRFKGLTKDAPTVFVSDRKTEKQVYNFKFGVGSNPQDAVFYGTKVFVTLYEKDYLVSFNASNSGTRKQISLKSYVETSAKKCTDDKDCTGSGKCQSTGVCKSDGLPEASRMLVVGDFVYVLTQGLDRNNFFTGVKSYLVKIDAKKSEVVEKFELLGTNPTAFIKSAEKDVYYIEQVGAWGAQDGGLQKVTFNQGNATLDTTWTLEEKDIKGDLSGTGSVVFTSKDSLYMIANVAGFKQDLVGYNLSTKKLTNLLSKQSLAHINLSIDGELLVLDKNPTAPGLRVFDAKTGKETTTKAIKVSDFTPLQVLSAKQ